MSENEGAPERVEIRCPSCGAAFDAMTAAFCECVSSDRTPKCPHCQDCLCHLPAAARAAFWRAAPASLRRARWDAAVPETDRPDTHDVDRPIVVVVEDDPTVRRLAALVVRRCGYRVVEVGNGQLGLELARTLQPAMVLTDALVPGLDGRDLCRALKTDERTRGIAVVIMTSLYTRARDRNVAVQRDGADEYLVKPIDARTLASLLRSRLGNSAAA